MRLVFFYDYPESGTEKVINAFQKELIAMGHEVDKFAVAYKSYLPEGFDLSLSNYDAAQFWNARTYAHLADTINIPYGVTIHHVFPRTESLTVNRISIMSPHWIHTLDNFTEQNLGRFGLISFVTPQIVDIDSKPLPPASTPNLASIGGNSDKFKRFEIIEDAARRLNIPSLIHNSSDEWMSKEKVDQFFQDTYIYVNACFGCSGPVPPQEALLCGRPVISTRISTMQEVIQEGVNGEFFDGGAKECAEKALKIMANYEWYSQNATKTKLNEPRVSAEIFIANIERKLKELE